VAAPLPRFAEVASSRASAAEFGADVWDVRRIPGARYLPHGSHRRLDFRGVPAGCQPLVKDFVRGLIAAGRSYNLCRLYLVGAREFLTRSRPEPLAPEDLRGLTAKDVEAYVLRLRGLPDGTGKPRSANQVNRMLIALNQFLRYLQRVDSPFAPAQPVERILWPEHWQAEPRRRLRREQIVPVPVLEQLDRHIHRLKAEYIPVVAVLRASGWRISDVLNLRHDTCLEHDDRGWFLCGDIPKTNVVGHKVPLTDEVAALIQAHGEWVRGRFSEAENPERSLFPATRPERRGRPIYDRNVVYALNRLAERCDIRGPDGEIFRFRTHAFRHSKAVELLNGGMSLPYVQQWLAHLTPEMTLVYARFLDATMRTKFEAAMARGGVRIAATGDAYAVDAAALVNGNELELAHVRHNLDSIRLPMGYCFKHQSFECPAALIPCYSCPAFVTTPDLLPQFEREDRETSELVAIAEQAGNARWAEANRRKQERLRRIIPLLRAGQVHQPLGKAKREYTSDERAARAAKRQQEGER
jgi:integrase